MRKRPQKGPSSKAVNFEEEVRNRLSALEDRVSRLESESVESWLSPKPPAVKREKGRRPKIELEQVLERRNQLVTWFERAWPFLSIDLRKANHSRNAVAAMMKAKTREPFAGQRPPFERSPQKHEAALWRFLQSGRFYQNPRNLAAAMAGLPELSWKRSFDICSGHPCSQLVAKQSWRDYLRRRFPQRLRELRMTKTTEEVRKVLRGSRSHDPTYVFLKEHPEQVFEWLNAGKTSVG
jgi:hypothetical protein